MKPPLDVLSKLLWPGAEVVVFLMVFASVFDPESVSRPVRPPLLF